MKKVLGTILAGVLFIACGEGKHAAEATPTQQPNTSNTTETNTTETKIDSKTSTATIVATSSTSTATAAPVPPTASKEDIESRGDLGRTIHSHRRGVARAHNGGRYYSALTRRTWTQRVS